MLVFSAIEVFVIISLAGLAIDGARLFMLRSNTQFAVSSAAAGAHSQLDGQPGAISRATLAANQIAAANIAATLSDSLTTASVTAITFYSALPNTQTSDDSLAKFVKVSGQGSTQTIFPFTPAALFSTSAQAVD